MKSKLPSVIILLLIAGLLTYSAVQAEGGYVLSAYVVAGGGDLQGGSYTLSGTAGQPEAMHAAHSGAYTLAGGFWNSVYTTTQIFLPLMMR
jgi:hypothetical protein